MILDQFNNADFYCNIMPRITEALEKMKDYSADNFPQGRVELDGENLFLLFNSYETHSPETAVLEAHQKYIDVMYMVQGEEIIFVKSTQMLSEITKPYDNDKDVLLAKLDSDTTPVRLTQGSFVVLFPQDAHAPGCFETAPAKIKKIIAKVKC